MKTVSDKLSARIIGVCLLLAILFYAAGNGLVESVLSGDNYNNVQLTTGGLFMLVNSIVIVLIGVVMLPILKRYNPQVAYLYLVTRIIEAILLAIGVVFLLLHLIIDKEVLTTQSNDSISFTFLSKLLIGVNYYSFQIAMLLLGVGSTLFCYIVYKSKLLPRFIAVWGIIGYVLLSVGSVFELYNCNIGLFMSMPGGLFEIFVAIWLIIKGFNNKCKQEAI